MKAVPALCLIAMATFVAAKPNGDKYTDKYDYINVAEILKNRKLLAPYINCALEQGRCTAEGKELRSHIKEALETYCAKCTEPQRAGTRQVLGHLINNEPEYWTKLTTKYDPAHKYVVRYENELRAAKTG